MSCLPRVTIILVAVALAALAFGGCQATVVSPAPPATASQAATGDPGASSPGDTLTPPPGGATPTPRPAPSTTPVAAPGLTGVLTCRAADVEFPADVLGAASDAELGASAAAAALRSIIGSEQGTELGFPLHGWRVAVEAPESVTLIAEGPNGWVSATVALTADSGWQFFEGGACDLAVKLPDGIGFASWRLDPADPPEPAATAVTVLATEIACASAKPPGGRLLAPIVITSPDAVTIALEVRMRPGGQDCPSNPEVTVSVDLGEPLGSRPLFDGSTVPPAPRS